MTYFHGTCSLALTLVFIGIACVPGDQCDAGEDCPCNDGTTQIAGCTVSAKTCDDACSGHSGFDAGVFVSTATDGG